MCSSKKVKNLLSDDTIPIEDKIDRISEQHLLSAIKDSNFEIVRNLLKNGADIRTCGEKGESALHLASRYAKTTDLIDFILKTGEFDIDGTDNDGLTPLHHAIMGSYYTKNVPHLIRLGADLTISDQKGNTPLHFAASHAKEMETISLILEKNNQIDINHINKDGETALHKAIVAKNVITARYLLDKGADPTIRENNGYTPFHMVGVFTDTAVLGLMLGNEKKKIDINVRNKEGGTALHNAVMHSNVTAARFLLSNGANPNVANEDGATPLHLAVENAKDMDIVDLLLNHKDTNVNYLDNEGSNALDYAKYYNKHGIGGEIANLLKGKGAAKAEGRNHEPKNKAASVGLPADHITEDSDIKSGYAKAMKLDYFLLKTDLHGPTAPKCTSDDNNDNMVKEVLEEAIQDSDTEKIRNLIEMGADLGKTMWREGANAL